MWCERQYNGGMGSVHNVKCDWRVYKVRNETLPCIVKKCPKCSQNLSELWFSKYVSTFCTFQDVGSEHVFDN